MNLGEKFSVPVDVMAEPLINRLVELDVAGEQVKARIEAVYGGYFHLKVVPDTVKE